MKWNIKIHTVRKYTLKSSVLGLAQIMIRPAGKMFTDKDLNLLHSLKNYSLRLSLLPYFRATCYLTLSDKTSQIRKF